MPELEFKLLRYALKHFSRSLLAHLFATTFLFLPDRYIMLLTSEHKTLMEFLIRSRYY